MAYCEGHRQRDASNLSEKDLPGFFDETSFKGYLPIRRLGLFPRGVINSPNFPRVALPREPRTGAFHSPTKMEDSGRACRYCLEEGDEPLVKPCECRGSSAFVHRSCLLRWQSQQMLSVASEGKTPAVALSCLVCKSRYTTEPPAPASLLELVRGTGGAALAALLLPGTFLVSRERALPDAATLASAPEWLRWIIEHKHRHWVKSVYLLTRVEARPDSENGDVLIGVNVTRARGRARGATTRTRRPTTTTTTTAKTKGDDDDVGDSRPRTRRRLSPGPPHRAPRRRPRTPRS